MKKGISEIFTPDNGKLGIYYMKRGISEIFTTEHANIRDLLLIFNYLGIHFFNNQIF